MKIGTEKLASTKLWFVLLLQLSFATLASAQGCNAADDAAILLTTSWAAEAGWNASTYIADWPGVTCNSSGIFM